MNETDSKETFIENVLDKLEWLSGASEDGVEFNKDEFYSHAEDCFSWGFSKADAVLWTRQTEDWTEKYNPTLSEEKALAKMREIGSKYPKYLYKRKV